MKLSLNVQLLLMEEFHFYHLHHLQTQLLRQQKLNQLLHCHKLFYLQKFCKLLCNLGLHCNNQRLLCLLLVDLYQPKKHVIEPQISFDQESAGRNSIPSRWWSNAVVMDLKRQLNGDPKREFVSEEEAELNTLVENTDATEEMSAEEHLEDNHAAEAHEEETTEGEQENTEVN